MAKGTRLNESFSFCTAGDSMADYKARQSHDMPSGEKGTLQGVFAVRPLFLVHTEAK